MQQDHPNRDFLESTRGHVAQLLRRGPLTVDDLADRLGLTPNAVRSHLQVLTRDGLVEPAGVRRTEGAGKPATLYQLTSEAEPLFSRAYLPVLRALLASLAGQPRAVGESLLADAARRLAEDVVALDGHTDLDPVTRGARLLESLGGSVEVLSVDHVAVIQGHGCPVSAVVAEHPEVCSLIRGLLQEVTARSVREECSRGERSSCRFLLVDPPSEKDSSRSR